MKVLIAEDETVSRKLLQAKLEKWGYEVIATTEGNQALQELVSEDSPRLAILDWMMPGLDGVQICREIRKRKKEPYQYIILLSAKDRMNDMIMAMDAGADDYITKPFEPNELEVRLRAGKRIIELQDELIQARDAIQFQATHDYLTGLWNRPAILDILRKQISRAQRRENHVSIAIADLDHFKTINDTYGHTVGDEVLCEAAKRWLASIRPYDEIGRYGGEEFLFVIPECEGRNAMGTAERIRECISSSPIDTSGGSISITVSLGVAASEGIDDPDQDTLIRSADAALYQAKEAGRNRVQSASNLNIKAPPPSEVKKQLIEKYGMQ